MPSLEPYQARFIELLIEFQVLRFGEFTLKSGRRSPYFIDAGQLRTGRAIRGLGRAYADRILEAGIAPDVVFGPSYKGIPLAVATASALAEEGRDVGFAFDRKEVKDHGEGGRFVGTQPADGQSIAIVDDVITSGGSIADAARLLRESAELRIAAVVVAVDRQERGREASRLVELQQELGAPILPVVSIGLIVEYLSREKGVLSAEQEAAVREHLLRQGALSDSVS